MAQACDTTLWQTRRSSAPAGTVAASGCAVARHGVVLAVCVGALVLAFLLKPETEGLSLWGYRWPWHCSLHEMFGVKCALCGLTRSFCCLAHGDVAAGRAFHRLGPAVFTLFCLEVPYRVYALAIRPRRLGMRLARVHVTLVALVAVAVFANWLLYLGEMIA